MLIKYYSLKKNNMVNIINLNTLLVIMIMMLLDHYIHLFHKRLDILINLKKNKTAMALMVEDKQLLQNSKKIWKTIKRLMGIDFESKATYIDKYINTKIKTYKGSITTNFYDKTGFKEVPEEKVPHKCLSIIILDSVLYAYEKHYPETFLEERKL